MDYMKPYVHPSYGITTQYTDCSSFRLPLRLFLKLLVVVVIAMSPPRLLPRLIPPPVQFAVYCYSASHPPYPSQYFGYYCSSLTSSSSSCLSLQSG